MASSRRTPDPARIAAAQIAGVTKRHVAGGVSADLALIEIGAALGPLAEVTWPTVLSNAAAHYVDSSSAADQRALELLVRAGANVDRARVAKDRRRGDGFVVKRQ